MVQNYINGLSLEVNYCYILWNTTCVDIPGASVFSDKELSELAAPASDVWSQSVQGPIPGRPITRTVYSR